MIDMRRKCNCHKNQQMCNKAVDDFLPALKFVPHRFVTSKMIKKVFTILYVDDNNILNFNEDSADANFLVMKWVFFV